MPRTNARFRLSIKDNVLRRTLKVELIETHGLWGERRYRLRVDGRSPANVKEATLTEIFERLRRWLVKKQARHLTNAMQRARRCGRNAVHESFRLSQGGSHWPAARHIAAQGNALDFMNPL